MDNSLTTQINSIIKRRDKSEELASRLQSLCSRYIVNHGCDKSDLHSKLAELLCEYITDNKYTDEDVDLKLYIHGITTQITDHLEDSISLPVNIVNIYSESCFLSLSRNDLYANRLAIELIDLIKKENKEKLLKLTNYSQRVTKLKSPKVIRM
jgi:glycosyltransferase involved in cell wall biosynthesis